MRQELMELMLPVFDTKKSSLIDSVSNQFLMLPVFDTKKSSLIDSVSKLRNRVHFE